MVPHDPLSSKIVTFLQLMNNLLMVCLWLSRAPIELTTAGERYREPRPLLPKPELLCSPRTQKNSQDGPRVRT